MELEEADAGNQEIEDQKRFVEKGFSLATDAAMPVEGVVIHNVYRTVHRATEDCGSCCGVKTNDISFSYTVDRDELEGCKLCWRSGCAPWERAPTEPAESEAAEVADVADVEAAVVADDGSDDIDPEIAAIDFADL